MHEEKHQAREPHGLMGRLFGWLMEWLNSGAKGALLEVIEPKAGISALEIGFGTGWMLEAIARGAGDAFLAGVDPSPLMVRWTRRRLKRLRGIATDIRPGDASSLPWADERFDVVLALHSFQFWSDPDGAARDIHRLLRPAGMIVLLLRHHPKGAVPDWLPNPITRSGDEVAGVLDLLRRHGFDGVRAVRHVHSSMLITARKP